MADAVTDAKRKTIRATLNLYYWRVAIRKRDLRGDGRRRAFKAKGAWVTTEKLRVGVAQGQRDTENESKFVKC